MCYERNFNKCLMNVHNISTKKKEKALWNKILTFLNCFLLRLNRLHHTCKYKFLSHKTLIYLFMYYVKARSYQCNCKMYYKEKKQRRSTTDNVLTLKVHVTAFNKSEKRLPTRLHGRRPIKSVSSSYSYFLNANFDPIILPAAHPRKIRKRTVNHLMRCRYEDLSLPHL